MSVKPHKDTSINSKPAINPGTTIGLDWREKIKVYYNKFRIPLTIWAVWRLATLVFPVFVVLLIPRSTSGLLLNNGNPWQDVLLGSWGHWDGNFYSHVGSFGYTNPNFLAFFPLYPHLMRFLAFTIGLGIIDSQNINLAGVLISSMAALVICLLLYRLAQLEYDSETAALTTLYLMAYPVAFFLFAVYAEALFLALAIGAFYAARTQRWRLAALLAAGAVLTRNQGVILVIALLLEYLLQIRQGILRKQWHILYFGIPLLAFSGWLIYNAVEFGSATRFLEVSQQYWYRGFTAPWDTFLSGGTNFFQLREDGQWLIGNTLPKDLNAFEFPLTTLFIILALAAGWAVSRQRLRLSYAGFFWLGLLQPLTAPTQNYPLMSMPRYFLILFPAFFLLAIAAKRWRVLHYTYLAVSLPLLVLMTARFVLWYWVA